MPNKQRRSKKKNTFFKDNWVEVSAAGTALFGIFLLVEPFDIRKVIMNSLFQLDTGINVLIDKSIAVIKYLSISDFVGLILVFLVLVVGAWRARTRLVSSDLYRSQVCPRCGGDLHRIHRRGLDKILEAFLRLELRRYACFAEGCRWQGLARHLPRDHHATRNDVATVEPEMVK